MSSFDKLQQRLGYRFSDDTLFKQALTHRSHSSDNNERLEFLGDSILNFLIAEELFNRFEVASEGQMSRLRAKLVRGKTLAEIARELNLGDHLIMGVGELKSGGFLRESILSDTLEAIIGAMYIDSNLARVRQCVRIWFSSRLDALSLDKTFKDAKSRLQEFLQGKQAALPNYSVVKTVGLSHDQIIHVECASELLEKPVRGEGSSRRIAEQNAASVALVELGLEDDHE